LRKALLGLVVVSLGVVWGQPGAAPPPNPLGALPAPLVGALMDLYMNYQQNRPRLAETLGVREAPLRVLHRQQIALLREWRGLVAAGDGAAAEAFLAVASRSGFDPTGNSMHHLCLSEDVAEPLRQAGAFLIKVARTPNEDALFLLLNDAQRP
jgi:hypothetical protein